MKFTGSSQEPSYKMNPVDPSPRDRTKTKSNGANKYHPGWEEIDDDPFPVGLRSVSRVQGGDREHLVTMPETAKTARNNTGITKTVEVNVYGTAP
jgi:hypothetical protein